MNDLERLRKKNANMKRELSHLHGKITEFKNRLKEKELSIQELTSKEKDYLNKIAELTDLVPPEVLKQKQVEWRQKAGAFTLRT